MKTNRVVLGHVLGAMLLCGAAQAASAETSPFTLYPSGWGWDVSWNVYEAGGGATIGLISPALYRNDHGYLSQLSTYLDASFIGHKNVYVDPKEGRFEEVSSAVISPGIQWTGVASDSLVATYTRIGAVYLDPAKALIEKDIDRWGGRLAIGLAIPYATQRSPEVEGKTMAVGFVESMATLGLDRADKLAGKPDLFNGFAMRFGFRLLY